jgi:peptidoglycan/LPS O-acetylase OafA/YrhL
MAFFGFSNIELPLNNWLGKVGSQSYGIYLSHSIVLIIVAKLVYHLLPAILEYQIILQPLLFTTGLGVPLLLMRLVKASPVKAVYGYLFG